MIGGSESDSGVPVNPESVLQRNQYQAGFYIARFAPTRFSGRVRVLLSFKNQIRPEENLNLHSLDLHKKKPIQEQDIGLFTSSFLSHYQRLMRSTGGRVRLSLGHGHTALAVLGLIEFNRWEIASITNNPDDYKVLSYDALIHAQILEPSPPELNGRARWKAGEIFKIRSGDFEAVARPILPDDVSLAARLMEEKHRWPHLRDVRYLNPVVDDYGGFFAEALLSERGPFDFSTDRVRVLPGAEDF